MIQNIEARLVDLFGPFGPLLAIGGIGLLLICVTLPPLLIKRKDPLDKLKEQARQQEDARSDAEAKELRRPTQTMHLERFATFLEPKDEEEYTAARLQMLQAGYSGRNAVRIFHGCQFVLGITALTIGAGYALIQSAASDTTLQSTIMTVLIPGAVGYLLPRYWIMRRRAERQAAIVNAFPDSLDMLLVCVEAGQSLDQAIIRVAREMRSGFPALAEEYEMVAYEMRAGKDKTLVLRDMAERCGVPDISSFVTVLIQSSQFGTSIAEALRVFSAEMRDKRVMRAEEKANTLPTKMTLATMMLTLPPLLIILIGPSIYDIYLTLGDGAAP
ncbi:type II secretion system F family protein [Pseudoroseicyclus aestuarii]|uniref:Tight adherence protein C n=1 Tax=Pseudoroseicyclus aestuarii TaxID=1795041 RepID=A0A318SXB7_9RHOB|nr:type II secretion system F family protein [Pseudoroseicyclus aestuarii]PYE84979.1 tight adherence protein C [Pseudoroseicyclus aestuarii]